MSNTLDLHGYTTWEAWKTFKSWITDKQKNQSIKKVVVITGDGEIKKEFKKWCEPLNFIRAVELHSTGGAFVIYFYKNRREMYEGSFSNWRV